jgi:hypothetical protein
MGLGQLSGRNCDLKHTPTRFRIFMCEKYNHGENFISSSAIFRYTMKTVRYTVIDFNI